MPRYSLLLTKNDIKSNFKFNLNVFLRYIQCKLIYIYRCKDCDALSMVPTVVCTATYHSIGRSFLKGLSYLPKECAMNHCMCVYICDNLFTVCQGMLLSISLNFRNYYDIFIPVSYILCEIYLK